MSNASRRELEKFYPHIIAAYLRGAPALIDCSLRRRRKSFAEFFNISRQESTHMADLDTLKDLLFKFRDDRNWQRFHNLKNLIISLNLESSELLELTQWKSDEELARLKSDQQFQEQLRDECADVLMYLLLIAGEGGFDLLQAAHEKLGKNALRYPVDQSYGSSKKHTELNRPTQDDGGT
jgi:NTP pyrophosphatase (non-canonical NTP hydrolase)